MIESYKEIYDNLPFFEFFGDEQKKAMLLASFPRVFQKSEILRFSGNYSFDDLYIIIDGCVDMVDKEGKVEKQLTEDDYFGDVAPLVNDFVGKTFRVASDEAVVLCLTKRGNERIFGKPFSRAILEANLEVQMSIDPFLSVLTDKEKKNLARYIKLQQIKKDEVLFRKGEKVGEQLVFLLHGNLIKVSTTANPGRINVS